jgi:prepilin-type N-terminal cleavage/methylation domain-containing protein
MSHATVKHATAFTLIELLVVISIVGVLLGLALPALAKARRTGAQVRESAALRQVGVAFAAYADDNRGAVLPGYTPAEWVTLGTTTPEVKAFYSDTSGQARLYGSAARRWTWRLAPYVGYARDVLVADRRLHVEFASLPDSPATRDGYQWAFASSPSFGINSTYVGGDARRGGFYTPALDRWGRFYVTAIDGARFPERLTTFATSRGYHPLDGSRVIPGRHRIEGPWRASRESDQVPTFSPWDAPRGPFDPSRTPTTYGHLDFRHGGKVLVTTFDTHVEPVGTSDIADMRRWCNLATGADWSPR